MSHWHPTRGRPCWEDWIPLDARAKPAEPIPVRGKDLFSSSTSAPSPRPGSLVPSLLLRPPNTCWGGPAQPSTPTGMQSKTRPNPMCGHQDGTRLPVFLPKAPAWGCCIAPVRKKSVLGWEGRGKGPSRWAADRQSERRRSKSIRKQPAPRQEHPERSSIELKGAARRHLQPRGDRAGMSPHRGRGAPAAKFLPEALRYQLQTIILPWRLTPAPCPGASWPDGAQPRPAGGDLMTLLICQTARHAAPAVPEPAGSSGLSPAPRRGEIWEPTGTGRSREEVAVGGRASLEERSLMRLKKREKRRCKGALLKQGIA